MSYYHPIFHEWHFQDGQGAGIVQFRSGSDLSDIRNKLTNALEAGWPRSGSMAFKNAVKHLGNIFGRNTGRKEKDVEVFTDIMQGRAIQDFMGELLEVKSLNEGFKIYMDLPGDVRQSPNVDEIFKNWKKDFEEQKALPQ